MGDGRVRQRTTLSPRGPDEPGHFRVNFRGMVAIFAAICLSGCSVLDDTSGLASSGSVVGDEPQAVQAGENVLAHGGDAADAAAATYLALSVTYSVAAGLGGGGICIVRDSPRGKTEEIDFLAREAAGGGQYAIPGNLAGFALLQSAYGRLPWQRVVSPAESFAAAGFPMSRALLARLATNQDVIRLDAPLAAEFLDESGHLKTVGTMLTAPALAQTLAQVRLRGPDALYRGTIADQIAAFARARDGAITTSELASYQPGQNEPARLSIEGVTALVPSTKVGAGQYSAALLSRLVDSQGHIADDDHTGAALASATKATLDAFGIASLPRDLGATGFAAEDSSGQAVACAVTMNGPFGSGRTVSDSGIVLASAPKSGRSGYSNAFLTPIIAATDSLPLFAGVGAGGPNGSAMITLALLDLARGKDLARPGVLRATGLEPFETVNIIQCQDSSCSTVPDPKAIGLAATGQ